MGCATSCMSSSVAELNKSLKAGDERALLHSLTACPKLLSTSTSTVFSIAVYPLHLACENKQIKVVQQVLTFLECSPLETVQEAVMPYCRRTGLPLPSTIAEGIRIAVNMNNAKGQTPLMYACYSDCPELVKMLVTQGADPWVGDRCGGRTALHYSAMGGSFSCIQALMKHIPPRLLAQRNTRYINVRSVCGLTPLHYAVYFGHLEALKELLQHDPTTTAGTTSESYDVSVTCEMSSTPLHFAAVKGNTAAARELLLYHAQRQAAGLPLSDPRTRRDAAAQLPWQVAFTHHPGKLDLAALMHPGQSLTRALGAGAANLGMAGMEGKGAASLASIAAAALQGKLLADLARVTAPTQTSCAHSSSRTSQAGKSKAAMVAFEAEVEEQQMVAHAGLGGCGLGNTDGQTEGSDSDGDAMAGGVCRAGTAAASSLWVCPGSSSGVNAATCTKDTAHEGGVLCSSGSNVVGVGSGDGWSGDAVGGSAAGVEVQEEDDEDSLCGVCFAARVAVAPAGCGHGVCSGCAEQLCKGITRRPLRCPFCRGVVSGLVAHVSQQGGCSSA